jgi:hypothetical protein
MEIGDIVIVDEKYWLKDYFPGYCEIIETKLL